MKKAQVAKFWRALEESSSKKEAISSLANKKGFDGEATLKRYAQVHEDFKQGVGLPELASKTGWSIKFVEKLHEWWKGQFLQGTQPGPQTTEDSKSNEQEEKLIQQVIKRWRSAILAYSPVRLLENMLSSARDEARKRYFSSEGKFLTETEVIASAIISANEELTDHLKRYLQRVHSTKFVPAPDLQSEYIALRKKWPHSTVLAKLEKYLDVWQEHLPASEAFDIIKTLLIVATSMVFESTLDGKIEGKDDLDIYIKKYWRTRAYAVILACSILERGLKNLKNNSIDSYWQSFYDDLENLRLSVSQELYDVTKQNPNQAWPSEFRNKILNDPDWPAAVRAVFLSKFCQAQKSLEETLKELESNPESLRLSSDSN